MQSSQTVVSVFPLRSKPLTTAAVCGVIFEGYMRFVVLILLAIAGCGGKGSLDSQEPAKPIGTWKTECFTDEKVNYWITTTYRFTETTAEQASRMYEDSDCQNARYKMPATSSGEYWFSKTVVTSSGIEANVYETFFLSREEGVASELGIFIDNDALYLVSESENGYEVNFNHPFYRMDE